jgi:hypothetical protein
VLNAASTAEVFLSQSVHNAQFLKFSMH